MEMETEGAMLEFMIDWWVRCKGANIWLLYIHHLTHFNHWNTVLTNPRLEVNLTNVLLFSFPPPFLFFIIFLLAFLFFTLNEYQRDYHEASSFWTLLKCRNLHESTDDFHEIILEISFWIETHNAIAAKFAIFFFFF